MDQLSEHELLQLYTLIISYYNPTIIVVILHKEYFYFYYFQCTFMLMLLYLSCTVCGLDDQLSPLYRCMRARREHHRTRSPPPPALQYGWKKATAGPPSRARRALRRPCSHMRSPSRSSSRTRVSSRLR